MPIFLEITTPASKGARPILSGSGPTRQVPSMKFNISLERNGEWFVKAPIPKLWRYVIPNNFAGGRWEYDITGKWMIWLMDKTDKKVVFDVRDTKKGGGPAFTWLNAKSAYDGKCRWKPAMLPSQKIWVGVALKGGAGLGIGAEAGLAAVVDLNTQRHGGSLAMGALRAGATAGASGGLAMLICTGFASVKEMHGHFSSGADYAIAVGPKFGGLVKSSKFATLLKNFDGGMEAVEGALKMGRSSTKLQAVLKEAPGAAKSAMSTYGMLVDTDAKTMVAIDIPGLGGGAELGVFYSWGKAGVLSSW